MSSPTDRLPVRSAITGGKEEAEATLLEGCVRDGVIGEGQGGRGHRIGDARTKPDVGPRCQNDTSKETTTKTRGDLMLCYEQK